MNSNQLRHCVLPLLIILSLCSCSDEDDAVDSPENGAISAPLPGEVDANPLDGSALNLEEPPGTPEIQENNFDVSDFDTPTEWQGLSSSEDEESEEDEDEEEEDEQVDQETL